MNEKINTRTLHFPQVGSYHAEIECTEKGARENILIRLSSSSAPLFINNKYWCSETVLAYLKIRYEADLNAKYIYILIHMHTQSFRYRYDTPFCLHCGVFWTKPAN